MAMNSAKMTILSTIQSARKERRALLAVLVDPDKEDAYLHLLTCLEGVDLVFVGGSTGSRVEECLSLLRAHTKAPLVLFPGNVAQFTPKADALLFLSLLNSRLPQVLIEPHLQVAMEVKQSGIETIPMGYILIDGHRKSAVEIVANCHPLANQDLSAIVRHAVAGQLLGKHLIYLEAGSGANLPVSTEIIHSVRSEIDIPLIVGGGICTPEQMEQAFLAGADVVVIGNHFETHPEQIPVFVERKADICR
jgi:putative glycerol-1-phosphate prenyltransferase